MHGIFHGTLPIQYFIHRPECRFGAPCREEDIRELKDCLEEHHAGIAALFLNLLFREQVECGFIQQIT